MKPVDMTIVHNPPESIGDWLRCVVASIMEMPAAKVPHFGQHDWNEDGSRGRLGLIEWLVPQGL